MTESTQVVLDTRRAEQVPRFSVIVALYNAEETLLATLASFDSQTLPEGQVEYVIVNDGSKDRSLEIAHQWALNRDDVVLITKSNGGIASTRNEALRRARGQWITSIDPDDLVESRYFEEVSTLIEIDRESRLALVSTRVLPTKHETGKFNTNHPLDRKFRSGNRVVDLRLEPNAFAIGATTFLRRDVIVGSGLTFDERIAPSFEDGNLILKYLSHFDDPIVGLASSAHYFYRKVSGGSSAVQSGWASPQKYLDQVEWGYLDALRYAHARLNVIPDWMAAAVCYDLMYFFKEYHKFNSKTRWATADHGEKFIQLCREIFTYVSVNQLQLLKVNAPSWNLWQALRMGFDRAAAPGRLFRWGESKDGIVNFTVMHRPDSGPFQVFSRGVPIRPAILGQKVHKYFGVTLAVEVSFSLPTGDAALFINGMPCPIGNGEPAERTVAAVPHEDWIKRTTDLARNREFTWDRHQRVKERFWVERQILECSFVSVLGRKVTRRLASKLSKRDGPDQALKREVEQITTSGGASQYSDCWFFMDHPDRADDNAEHLYRYVRDSHPEINAVFALERGSKDWARLEADGFHLVDYGSPAGVVAALSASVVLSSDAVEACMYPAPRRIFGKPGYKFVFLQHGISEKDISAWLRGKKIALCICATPDEFAAFSWKDSPYEFQLPQLTLSGFPRHDALLQKSEARRAESHEPQRPKRLLIIPTWRKDLRESLEAAGSEEQAQTVFLTSRFGRSWLEVLDSPALRQAIRSGCLEVDFLLHPNFSTGLKGVSVPEGVRLLRVGEKAFQEMLVECDLFVTDYSSLAFDASYIGRPISYFQFDSETLGSGAHSWVPGYFDYQKMGLGPVHTSADEVGEWVIKSLDNHCEVPSLYRSRVEKTFLAQDQNNSARVTESVRALLNGTWPASRPTLPVAASPGSFGA